MLDKKDFRGGVSRMREVARLLSEWADDMESSLPEENEEKEAVSDPVSEDAVPVDAAPAAAADESAPAAVSVDDLQPDELLAAFLSGVVPMEEMTCERVRWILGKKSADGYKEQVRALIYSFGASCFSDLDPTHYKALLEAVALLGPGGGPDAG